VNGIGIELRRVSLALGGRTVLRNITLDLAPGSHTLLVGANGAGKTQLLKLLAGERWPTPTGRELRRYVDPRGASLALAELLPRLALVSGERQDKYLRYGWNHSVAAVVGTGCAGSDIPRRRLTESERARVRGLLRRFGLWRLRRRRLLSLSYGERRLALVARALAARPRLLLLDEIYNGLDGRHRLVLDRELARLCATAVTLVVSAHRALDAPSALDRAIVLDRGRIAFRGARRALPGRWLEDAHAGPAPAARRLRTAPAWVELENVDLYRDYRAVLSGVSVTIRRGEHWAILGGNGAGKSTLLQCLYGDLSAAFGGRVRRAGHTPGTPLELWRKRIGYVTPELQAEQPREQTLTALVVSGLRASVGLSRPASARETRAARAALATAGVAALAARRVREVSYGELRLALLARALVANPEALLLDEPLTGLDARMRGRVRSRLEGLAADGVQLVMACHHAADLLRCTRHVLVLRRGRAHPTASDLVNRG
jgi:molybdate transport system ATP-binding protein